MSEWHSAYDTEREVMEGCGGFEGFLNLSHKKMKNINI